ncbi:MAG: polysaccharide biosynthesis protein [Anaerotignum sp.]|nr:polysaccharide biosynthesis protein [Anaerotignum sp.]
MAAREKKKSGGSFIKQAAILAAASLLVRFLGFVYRLPLTNMIGDEGNAIYAGGYYIYTFLLILSSAGLPAAISRLVSERIALKQYRNAHRVFHAALIVSTTLGILFALLLFFTAEKMAVLVQSPDSYYAILTLCPTLVIVAIMSVFRGYFQGMHTMVPTAISQIIEQVFNAFFSVYLAWVFLSISIPEGMTKNIPLAAAGGTMGTGIGALAGLIVVIFAYCLIRKYLLWRAKRCKQPYEESKRELIGKVLQTAWPIIAGTAVFSITNLVDMAMVMRILVDTGFTQNEAEVLYGQLSGKFVTLTTLPVTISTAIATAALPSIAASVKLKEKKQVRRKMALTYRISMIISVPAAVGISALGPQILAMLFPSASDGGMLLTVGGISIIFLALCQTSTGILQGIGHIKVPVVGAILGAITKVILNALLIRIPAINVLGAVLSTTGCYLVAGVFDVIMLSRLTGTKFDFMGSFLKPVIGSIAMAAGTIASYQMFFQLIGSNTIATLLAICVAIAIYGLVMLLIRGIVEEDLKAVPGGGKMIRLLKRLRLI